MVSIALFVALNALAVAPDLPAGCDSSFMNTCLIVEDALEKGDFAKASEFSKWLPRKTVRISWNDKDVPSASKLQYAQARDKAISVWKQSIPNVNFVFSKTGDIDFSFVPQIPQSKSDLFIPGARHKVKLDDNRKIVSVISLCRGVKLSPITEFDIQNEVGFAIGYYFGLTPSPTASFMMGRTDQLNRYEAKIGDDEIVWTKACLNIADVLRNAITTKTKLIAARASAAVSETEPKETNLLQGESTIYRFRVRNDGNANLNFSITSTCACLIATPKGQIAPGKTVEFEANFDSTDFTGDITKHLYLYTNDAERPVTEIPIVTHITPRFRLLTPAGKGFLLEEKGVDFDVYLCLAERADMKLQQASLEGMQGEVTFEPWQGELPDPERNEPSKSRTGYRVHVKVPDQQVFGKKEAILVLNTNHLQFRRINTAFAFQKGMIISPIQFFMGMVEPGQKSKGIISSPGRSFKVVRIECPVDWLVATFEPGKDGSEYRILVQYKGNAPKGPFLQTLKVITDDPKHSEVIFQVRGEVQ